jgi:hypothetical protein
VFVVLVQVMIPPVPGALQELQKVIVCGKEATVKVIGEQPNGVTSIVDIERLFGIQFNEPAFPEGTPPGILPKDNPEPKPSKSVRQEELLLLTTNENQAWAFAENPIPKMNKAENSNRFETNFLKVFKICVFIFNFLNVEKKFTYHLVYFVLILSFCSPPFIF